MGMSAAPAGIESFPRSSRYMKFLPRTPFTGEQTEDRLARQWRIWKLEHECGIAYSVSWWDFPIPTTWPPPSPWSAVVEVTR